MEMPPPGGEGGAVNLTGDSPSCLISIPPGKILFERADGTRFAVGGATAQAVLLMMKRPVTTLDLWPRRPGEPNTTTRFGSMLSQLRHRYGLTIETEWRPNVRRPGRHGVYALLDTLKLVRPERHDPG